MTTTTYFSIRIEDCGRSKHSPWFTSSAEAQAWLDDPGVREDHGFRFLSPRYCLEAHQVVGGELIVLSSTSMERTP